MVDSPTIHCNSAHSQVVTVRHKFPVTVAKVDDLYRRMETLGVREDDLVESYFKTVKSGGKAGLIGVMIFHASSGFRVRCNRERSQGINRFLARRTLVALIEKRARRAVESRVRRDSPAPFLHRGNALQLESKSAALPPQMMLFPTPPVHWGLGSDEQRED